MSSDATTRVGSASAPQVLAWASLAAALLGVFLTWTGDGPVRLDGTDGPNNGWLVVIVALLAIGWARAMLRGSWVGVLGTLGSALVIGWTAAENWLDSRAVEDASARAGLVLVLAGGVGLAIAAVLRGLELTRSRRG